MSAASDKPKQDFPDCAFCAPCRCDDECGCVGAGCWACGHRYDDVSGAVFIMSGQVVSDKPAPPRTEKLEVDLYLEGLDHAIEDSKAENSKTFFRNLKVLISDLFAEAQRSPP